MTDKAFKWYEQSEVNYTPLSMTAGQACASCRFYDQNWCRIVHYEPEPIEPTGWCDLWTTRQVNPMPDMPMDENMMDDDMKTNAIVKFIKSLFTSPPAEPLLSGFKVLADGRWLAFWTNNFEDREAEIFSEKAIDNYVQRVRTGVVPYPELWAWHIPGTKHGRATHIQRLGHFAVAIGEFDNTPMAEQFKQFYQRHARKMSHGYMYPPAALIDGVYHAFTTFEISTLHPTAAANSFTSFEELSNMANISENAKQELRATLGQQEADRIIAAAEQGGKGLEEAGTRYKAGTELADTEARSKIEQLEAQVKTLSTQLTAYLAKAQPAPAPEPAPLDPRIDALTKSIETLTQQVGQVMQLQPPASASPQTQLSDDNKMAAWLTQMYKQSQQQPGSFIDMAMMGMPMGTDGFTAPFGEGE